MNDSEVSAEQFSAMFQEECENVAKNAFGKIKLSLEEVKSIASDITFGDMTDGLNTFTTATSDTQQALSDLQSSVSTLKKENWKVSLGMKLDELQKDDYKSASYAAGMQKQQYRILPGAQKQCNRTAEKSRKARKDFCKNRGRLQFTRESVLHPGWL